MQTKQTERVIDILKPPERTKGEKIIFYGPVFVCLPNGSKITTP